MKSNSKTIHVKWVRSAIGFSYRQKRMVKSLGLRRLNHTVELQDTPSVRGLVSKLSHLVQVVNPEAKPDWAAVPECAFRPPEDAEVKARRTGEQSSGGRELETSQSKSNSKKV